MIRSPGSLGLRIGAVVGLLVLGMVYPFLPGGHDRVALAVSLMIQAGALPGALLVPLGLVWLFTDFRRRQRGWAPSAGFAWVALIVMTLAVVMAAAVATGERTRLSGYPEALEALHPDYSPSVIGVDRYHYARRREGYDLSFEQPRLLLDDIGAREIVVYSPRDEHLMPSHAAGILSFSPAQLASNQGWFAFGSWVWRTGSRFFSTEGRRPHSLVSVRSPERQLVSPTSTHA